MSRWFRFYDSVLDDPKVQRLPGDSFKAWVNLLCLASRNGGVLPPLADIAFGLRVSEDAASQLLDSFCQYGLLDPVEVPDAPMSYEPHNWGERQFQSDNSTARVKRFRKNKRNVSETASETDQSRTEADTEQKQSRADTRSDSEKRVGDFCQAIVRVYAEANSPTLPDTSLAQLWLAKGFDPEICLGSIAATVKRKPNASLAYCEPGIVDAHKSRAPPRKQIAELPRHDWEAATKSWFRFRTWPKGHGPDPDSPACQCPREFLEKRGAA